MSAALRRFDAYQPSAVRWIDDLPTHWRSRRIKTFLREVDERSGTGEGALLTMRRASGLVPLSDFSDKIAEPERLRHYKVASPGQIVMNPMQAGNGMFAICYTPGLISPDYRAFELTDEADPRYLVALFKSEAMRATFRAESKGLGTGTAGFLRLYPERFGSLFAPFPPLEEQRRIADYIDAYSVQVHRLVAAKRRLLKAVHERNQLALHELLVRGLNNDGPRTPSGHPWLGDVPKGWGVAPLKQFAAVNPTLGRSLPDRAEEVAFLPMERIGVDANVDYGERRQIQAVSSGFTSFAAGDVVLAKITPCFENGKAAWLNEMPTQVGFGTTELHVLRPTSRLRPELLLQWLRLDLFRQWGAVSMVGAAGQQRVPPRFVRDFVIAVSPSAEEQERMVVAARALNDEHHFVTDRIRREIDLILEYRDNLIAAAVTGRLDVREAAIPVLEGDELISVAAAEVEDEDVEDLRNADD